MVLGDNTSIIKKGEWLEVAAYNEIKETCSLITSDVQRPISLH
jgi:hypothetical protein